LTEANKLELLRLTGDAHIPRAVEAELARYTLLWHSPTWLSIDDLTEPHRTDAVTWQRAGLIDAGEAEAIALAKQLHADWLFTDDAAARLLAQTLGLEVHGSLGVVLWAATTGHLNQEEAEKTLEDLAQSSLWLSPKVLKQVRTALDQLYAE
jgi:predicted nucleic acid-binding protein